MPTVHTPLSQPHPCPGQQGSKTSSKHLPWEHRQPSEVSSGMEPPGCPSQGQGPSRPRESHPTLWLKVSTHSLASRFGSGNRDPSPGSSAPVCPIRLQRAGGDRPSLTHCPRPRADYVPGVGRLARSAATRPWGGPPRQTSSGGQGAGNPEPPPVLLSDPLRCVSRLSTAPGSSLSRYSGHTSHCSRDPIHRGTAPSVGWDTADPAAAREL